MGLYRVYVGAIWRKSPELPAKCSRRPSPHSCKKERRLRLLKPSNTPPEVGGFHPMGIYEPLHASIYTYVALVRCQVGLLSIAFGRGRLHGGLECGSLLGQSDQPKGSQIWAQGLVLFKGWGFSFASPASEVPLNSEPPKPYPGFRDSDSEFPWRLHQRHK